jgi:hypothetical protein
LLDKQQVATQLDYGGLQIADQPEFFFERMKRKSGSSDDSRSSSGSGSSNNSGNRSTSFLVFLIIGIAFLLFILSFYFIITTLFLSTFPITEPPHSSLEGDDHSVMKKQLDIDAFSQPVYEDKDSSHLFLKVLRKEDPSFCLHRNNLYENSEVLHENEIHDLSILSNYDQFQHYQLCLAYHPSHQHTIRVDLLDGSCDIYFATTHLPTPTHWDWKLNHRLSKKISIHTYAPEFRTLNDGTFFISAVPIKDQEDQGKHPSSFESENNSPHCQLGIQITEYSNEKLLHLLPALRGKVLLQRDIENLTHAS